MHHEYADDHGAEMDTDNPRDGTITAGARGEGFLVRFVSVGGLSEIEVLNRTLLMRADTILHGR
jgi:hypothetical protein